MGPTRRIRTRACRLSDLLGWTGPFLNDGQEPRHVVHPSRLDPKGELLALMVAGNQLVEIGGATAEQAVVREPAAEACDAAQAGLAKWENLSRSAYNAKKEEVAKTFIGRLEKVLPGIEGEIEYYEVGTPATIKRYTLNPGGAVYGFAQVPSKPVIDSSSLPDNLHFASAWGKTGGGFSGAIYSGYLCAYNILRKRNL